MQLTWLGHSAVHLDIAGKSVLIDPFWTGNPKHPQGFEDRLGRADFIVLTHGHSDHVGDSARLAQKYGATVVAQFEIVSYLGGQGVDQAEPMNIGGTVERDGLALLEELLKVDPEALVILVTAYGTIGPAGCFALNAAGFLVMTLMLARVRLPQTPVVAAPPVGRALREDPSNDLTLGNLERLADATRAWESLAQLYEQELTKTLDKNTKRALKSVRAAADVAQAANPVKGKKSKKK